MIRNKKLANISGGLLKHIPLLVIPISESEEYVDGDHRLQVFTSVEDWLCAIH
jgi:hypothetical protein